jgi:hypothetical protein
LCEMAQELKVEYLPEFKPGKFLQATLCEPLHRRRLHNLVEAADEATRLRLASQRTQHANSWTLAAPSVSSLSAAEFRAGLRFALGIPFRAAEYKCPDCGADADPLGTHAVCCQRSGHITRAHTALRDVVTKLFQEAGYTVTVEAPVPGCPERPADLLVHSWNGRPLAVDFTIVTPTAPSAARGPTAELLLDRAALAKMKRNSEPCARAGWVCQPFACDVFGAVRSEARRLVAALINKRLAFAPMERPSEVGRRFWSAITTATLARAAVQLARLTAMDSTPLCPEGVLALRTARGKRSLPQLAPRVASHQLQLLVRAPDSSTLLLQVPSLANLEVLQRAIEGRVGIPVGQQRLTFSGQELNGGQPLRAFGIHDGAELQFCWAMANSQPGRSNPPRTGVVPADSGMGSLLPFQPSLTAVLPPSLPAGTILPLPHHTLATAHPIPGSSKAGNPSVPEPPAQHNPVAPRHPLPAAWPPDHEEDSPDGHGSALDEQDHGGSSPAIIEQALLWD